jgi:hypothetical protein
VFRRLFWLVVGAGFGFGLSFWVVRAFRQTAERYAPGRLGADLGGAIRGMGSDLRVAAVEGRAAMREREYELRNELRHSPSPS